MLRIGLAVVLTLSLTLAPLAGHAQTRKIPRVGIVSASSPTAGRQAMDAFRAGLRELGYIEGQTLAIEERWAEGRPERFGELIADLLQSKVDVLVVGSAPVAKAAQDTPTTTPVVFLAVTDPVGNGIVSSLARPGGNLTGTSLVIGEQFAGKWVELVKDALPRVSTVAALAHTGHPMARKYVKAMEAAALTLGLKLRIFEVRDVTGLESALSMIAKAPPSALIVPLSPLFGLHRKRIADFLLPRGIPTIGHDRSLAVDGMLMSYGPSIGTPSTAAPRMSTRSSKAPSPPTCLLSSRRSPSWWLISRRPRTLGLTIPQSLPVRADEIIQ